MPGPTLGGESAKSSKSKKKKVTDSKNKQVLPANVVGHILKEGEKRSNDVSIDENIRFADMFLKADVLSGLTDTGFHRPSPVQLKAIPSGLCGLDLIVQAKSGTGKTCVFTVLALEMVIQSATTTQVMVIAPTREIAVQIADVIISVSRHLKQLKVGKFIGGTEVEKPGVCHIAVGTPGRLHHMLSSGMLKGDNIRLFVLDEADQLLDSFRNEVKQIMAALPSNKQIVCASATYTEPLQNLASEIMRTPVHITVSSEQLLAVTQYVHMLPYTGTLSQTFKAKLLHLRGLLNSIMFNQCMIFTNSIMKAESVTDSLKDHFPVDCLCGGKTQQERLKAFDDFQNCRCRVLVATDLAARGLDSSHVSLVVSLDPPVHPHTYLHRVGRAGRYGAPGITVVLASYGDDWLHMQAIATVLRLKIRVLPEPDLKNAEEAELAELPYLTKEKLNEWIKNTSHRLSYSMDGGNVNKKGFDPLEIWKIKDDDEEAVEETEELSTFSNGNISVLKDSSNEKVNGRSDNSDIIPNGEDTLENPPELQLKDNFVPTADEATSDKIYHIPIQVNETNPDKPVLMQDDLIKMFKQVGSTKLLDTFSYTDILDKIKEIESDESVTAGDIDNLRLPVMQIGSTERTQLGMYLKDVREKRKQNVMTTEKAWHDIGGMNITSALKDVAKGVNVRGKIFDKVQQSQEDAKFSQQKREIKNGNKKEDSSLINDFSFHMKAIIQEKKIAKDDAAKKEKVGIGAVRKIGSSKQHCQESSEDGDSDGRDEYGDLIVERPKTKKMKDRKYPHPVNERPYQYSDNFIDDYKQYKYKYYDGYYDHSDDDSNTSDGNYNNPEDLYNNYYKYFGQYKYFDHNYNPNDATYWGKNGYPEEERHGSRRQHHYETQDHHHLRQQKVKTEMRHKLSKPDVLIDWSPKDYNESNNQYYSNERETKSKISTNKDRKVKKSTASQSTSEIDDNILESLKKQIDNFMRSSSISLTNKFCLHQYIADRYQVPYLKHSSTPEGALRCCSGVSRAKTSCNTDCYCSKSSSVPLEYHQGNCLDSEYWNDEHYCSCYGDYGTENIAGGEEERASPHHCDCNEGNYNCRYPNQSRACCHQQTRLSDDHHQSSQYDHHRHHGDIPQRYHQYHNREYHNRRHGC